MRVDLTDWEATRAALSPLPAMHGVVNNAAIAVLSSFLDTQPDDFDRCVEARVGIFRIQTEEKNEFYYSL